MADSVTFVCNFPPTQGAIRISGNGDGMRIQLDIPENQMGEAVRLLMWRERVLRVTVEPAKDDTLYNLDG